MTRVVILLEIDAEADAAFAAVDSVLDAGTLQDEITDVLSIDGATGSVSSATSMTPSMLALQVPSALPAGEANIPRVMFISLLNRMLDRVEREERWIGQTHADLPTRGTGPYTRLAGHVIDAAVARAQASGVLAGLLCYVNATGTTAETSAVIARADALKIERNL